jgi:Cu+-exporting ATPase
VPDAPEIERDAPGACPICGMALEPRVQGGAEPKPRLLWMTRAFWISAGLSRRAVLGMLDMMPGGMAAGSAGPAAG